MTDGLVGYAVYDRAGNFIAAFPTCAEAEYFRSSVPRTLYELALGTVRAREYIAAVEIRQITRGSHQPHNAPDTGTSATYDGVTGADGGPVD